MPNSFNLPAPRWYRITKKIWSNTENAFIVIWLATGHTQDSLTLVIFKVASSFVKDTLDSFLTNGQEYAPVGSKDALMQMMPDASTPKEAVSQVLGKGYLNEPVKADDPIKTSSK